MSRDTAATAETKLRAAPEAGPEGIPSAANDPSRPAGFFLACGYFPAGPRVVRLDRLERAATVLARLSRSGPFAPPRELPGILGCRESELAAVLGALGYAEREDRFERRAPLHAKRREAPARRRFRSR